MENSSIIISIVLMIFNVIALKIGHTFDKFKITVVCLVILDVLMITNMSKLI